MGGADYVNKEVNKKLRLVFVIGSLGSGGAERVLSILANHWAVSGWNICIITYEDKIEDFYDLENNINRIHLNFSTTRNILSKILRFIYETIALRKAIIKSNSGIIISFITYANMRTLCTTRFLNIPVIVSEHWDPNVRPIGLIRKWICNYLYPKAKFVITLSETAKKYFSKEIQAKTQVIPNPVLLPPASQNLENKCYTSLKKSYKIISLGRLIPIKGFDRLIMAFSKIAASFPDWSLEIWGEGSTRNDLEQMITHLHLDGRVKLPGLTKVPYCELVRSDLFVMSSHTEGFPMALCEAMACGLPVISFDCPSGPREIVRDGMDGILVPNDDIDALAKTIAYLIDNPEVRDQLAHNARDVVIRFGIEKVAAQWEALIDKALSK